MFPAASQRWARSIAELVVAPLARWGVNPNTITIVGFLLNIATALVIAFGHLTLGGAVLLFSAMFDMLDGALARVTAHESRFGAFLDSLLDRYSEAMIFAALLYQETTRGHTGTTLLVFAAAIGSVMISYARARAEGLGLDGKVGIAPRPERVLILGLGLFFGDKGAIVALIILSVLTHATAIQRLYHVWRQTDGKAPETEPTTSITSA